MPVAVTLPQPPAAMVVTRDQAASVRAIRLRLEALSLELRRALGDGTRK